MSEKIGTQTDIYDAIRLLAFAMHAHYDSIDEREDVIKKWLITNEYIEEDFN